MKTVISIVLILVGLIGIYFVSKSSNTSESVPVIQVEQTPVVKTEQISVAVAKKDLSGKTILTLDDFAVKVITVSEGASEKSEFSIGRLGSLENWAITAPVMEGSNIPVSILVKPGTDQYISMFLEPGHVVYSFIIPASDYYIFDNLKVGEFVDIYLAFDKDPSSGEVRSVDGRANVTGMRLKPIMVNKRVLSITPSLSAINNSKSNKNNVHVEDMDGDDRVVVELTDYDVKILKALEGGKAKFLVFPTVPAEVIEERENDRKAFEDDPNAVIDSINNVLTNRELNNWPVTNEELFVNKAVVKRIEG